jgi:transposase InsO family protein
MLALVGKHPRFGYRRIWALLRHAGWKVNRKRVYRLWLQEGLKVPQKQRKRRRLGHSGNSCVRRKSEHKDHVWTWDFIHDRTVDGRPLKWLSIMDEYTRECLALEACTGSAEFAARLIEAAKWDVRLAHAGAVHRLKQGPDKTCNVSTLMGE